MAFQEMLKLIDKAYEKIKSYKSAVMAVKRYPRADGSFIQLDMTYQWDDAKWQSELRYLKDVGMHYLVVMGTAFTKGTETKTVYPTCLPHCMMKTKNDVIDICLRNAEKEGLKVFLAINFNNEWWKKAGCDSKWLYAQMAKDNLIADELFKIYHFKYPRAFFGWYWSYEVDNMNFQTSKQFSVLSNALNIQLRFMKSYKERLPILISPFMNSAYSSPKKYADGWSYVFKHTDFMNGDIFCPQDCVGGGGVDIEDISRWFDAFRKAVGTRPELLFWANTECFDHTYGTSAPLNRFIRQMETENPYVGNIITFSYSHYYSPNNIHKGFHETYTDYIKNGYLKQQHPFSPANLKVEQLDGNRFRISWEPSKGDIEACGYEVYRNNTRIFRTEIQRKYGGDGKGPLMTCIDVLGNGYSLKNKLIYEVRAFDFAGNFSESKKVSV